MVTKTDGSAMAVPGGQVTYTISVPVRTTTAESVALFRINANDDEAIASDADILVLFRNGFDPN